MNHPNVDLRHGPVVDYVEDRYFDLYGRKTRDPWRAIRNLHQRGFLVKVRKGVYRYDPDSVGQRTLEDFTPEQREEVLERDEYRCVICGRGKRDKVELQVDHIKPRNLDGNWKEDVHPIVRPRKEGRQPGTVVILLRHLGNL